MAHHHVPSLEDTKTTLDGLGGKVFAVSAAVGVIGLVVSIGLGLAEGDDLRHFGYSYLVNFAFFLAIALGALFFLPIQYVTKASWIIVVRRLVEVMAASLPVLALLAVPVVVLAGRIYGWAAPEAGSDPLLAHKVAFLSPRWFTIRWAIYFGLWTWLSFTFWRRSLAQDATGDLRHTHKLENFSGFALLVYALSVSLAGMDLLMSVDYIWFSTIFGVYFWAGGLVSFFAVLTLVTMGLQKTGRLTHIVSPEHFHDYGKLMFAFTFFWAYIAFSQYMLYWYANIPEETGWYLLRSGQGWGKVGMVVLFAAFLLPFAGLISRYAKRNRKMLAFWAAWIVVAQWINLYWVVMPEYSHDFVFSPMDVTLFFGIGGTWLAAITRLAMGRSLVPMKDPRLDDSLRFENA
ncbi:MAG: quinol:cytochrome C oxidoreductase [bacterium]|nr:quinol:cytochrome C oxidoreductase [bacterium]